MHVSPMRSRVQAGCETTPSGAPIYWIRIDVDPLVRVGGFTASALDRPVRLPGRLLNGGSILLSSMEAGPDELISILETAASRLRGLKGGEQ